MTELKKLYESSGVSTEVIHSLFVFQKEKFENKLGLTKEEQDLTIEVIHKADDSLKTMYLDLCFDDTNWNHGKFVSILVENKEVYFVDWLRHYNLPFLREFKGVIKSY